MKVLLTGDFSEVFRDVSRFLEEDFEVQLSPFQTDSIKGIAKIAKPALAIICKADFRKEDEEIFAWFRKNLFYTPVVVLVTKDDYPLIASWCGGNPYHVVYRPITNVELLEACRGILGVSGTEEAKEPEAALWELPDGKEAGGRWRRKEILVVDDSGLMLRNIKEMLRDRYEVRLAKSGEQAIKMLHAGKPDLILLDYNMPGMDGCETFDRIRTLTAEAVPVIFLTSVSEREKIYAVLQQRPAGYVLKPPDRAKLLSMIEDTLAV